MKIDQLLFTRSALSLVLVACSSAGPEASQDSSTAATEAHPPEAPAASGSASGTGVAAAPAGGCAKKDGVDPSVLLKCTAVVSDLPKKTATGRCVPRSQLGSFDDTFLPGDCSPSNACVPDEIVRTGGSIDLKPCKTLGREGRCFWPLAKAIASNLDLLESLTSGQCDADTVCAPCVNPLDGKSTGLCELSSKSAPCTSK